MATPVSFLRSAFDATKRRRSRAAALVFAQIAAVLAIVVGVSNPAAAGPRPVMYGYIPIPANDLVAGFEEMRSGAGTTLDFTVGLTSAGSGAVLTYDHWEDGYESDLANPTQSSTRVFGDANTANGDASSFCSVCSGDTLPQGAPLILRNNVPTPRPASGGTVLFDGRDKVGSTRGFTITSGGFTTDRGSLQASVVSAYDTSKYGTSFTVPVGVDTPVPARASDPFAYTAASIMAASNGTVVEVDTDDDGDADVTQTINEGQAIFVRNLAEGATVSASEPVQVHLITGDPTATYESRSFPLFADGVLSNDYMSPVGTGRTNFATNNFLYNPNDSAIVVTPTCDGCLGTITVPANASATFRSPADQAVRFRSDGGRFIAVAGVGAHSGSESDNANDNSSSWDWGFTMVPTSQLTTQVVLGWAPGNSNNNPANPEDNRDDGPVWITTMTDTTLRVDYDGNPATGSIASADCFGSHDREISVSALASTRLFDGNDGTMTGARIYTCDGTLIAGAWGENPDTAPTGTPGFDAGYTIIPSTTMVVDKSAALADDIDGDGRYSPGDTVTYTVAIADAGSLAFTNVVMNDTLREGMTYVPGTTTFDDGDTTVPYADDVVPAAATAFPFDEDGGSIPSIEAGQIVEISFDVTVDAPYLGADGTLGNTACVTAQEATGCDTSVDPLAQADLWLTKDVQGSPERVGDEATFVVTVGNDGPDDVAAVEVTDLLPAGTTYVSSNPSQGTYDSTTGIWNVGGVAVDDEATLEIVATIDRESVTNYAQITNASAFDVDSQPAEGPLGAGNPPNQDDEDSAPVVVDPAAIDLRLAKELDSAGDHVGDEATFELTVTNDGPSDATGVAVLDRLPAGLTYVSSDPSQGAYAPATGIWTVGDLDMGDSATLRLTATVDTTVEVTNIAQVSAADQADVDSTPANSVPTEDDQASAPVQVDPLIDLSVTKDLTTAPTHVGDRATFRVTVTNGGPSPATGVVVTDRFGADLDVVSSSDPDNFDPDSGAWIVGDLGVGASASIDITFTVEGTEATNLAEVTAANEDDVDSAPAEDDLETEGPNQDDEDGVDVTADPAADLSLTKDLTDAPAVIGEEATFVVTVVNDGPSEATGVVVTDRLPAGLTYVSSDPSQGTYDPNTGIWAVGTLADRDSASLTIVATANSTSVRNFAEITDANEHDRDSQPAEGPLDGNNPPDQDDEDSALVEVAPLIDLSVDKAVTAAGTHVGDRATFQVTVANDGPSTATGVVVDDLLPAGLTYISSNPSQGSYNEGTGAWTVGELADGDDATLAIVVRVDTDEEVTNVAQVVAADQDDVDSTPDNDVPTEDDQDDASLQLDPLVDVSLTKELVAAPTYVGDMATFRLTATNQGPSDATGVVVTDLLPAGLTFLSANGGTYDDATGEWTIGNLEADGTRQIDITVTVDTLGETNHAEVTETNEDDVDSTPAENPLNRLSPPDQDDEDDAEVTAAPVADLSLTKEQTGTPSHIGDNATFTIIVRNDGPSAATGVQVTDELPVGLTFVSSSPSQGSYNPGTGIWAVGNLADQASARLTIVASVHTGSVRNFAEITDVVEHDRDSQPAEGPLDSENPPDQDDEDDALVQVAPRIDLSLDKSITAVGTHVGEQVTFRLAIANAGPSTATGVTVGDVLPAGLTFESSTPSQGTYDPTSGTWNVGEIANGEGATLDIVATVTTDEPVTNVAEVTDADQDDLDSTPGNDDPDEDDQDDASLDVEPLIDLALTKEIVDAPTYLLDEATFRLTVTNDGPSDATGVVVTDLLPEGLTFVSASGGSYDADTGEWTIGDLEADGRRELEITVTVDRLTATNRAEVTSAAEDDVDSQPAEDPLDGDNPPNQDDEDLVDVTVAPIADLSLTKTSSPGAVQQGDDARFTLTVRNDGPSTATGVVVTDQLPAGVTFVAADASQGAYDPETGLWTIGTLELDDEVTLDIDVTVDAAGPITNTAEITASEVHDPDSTPDNDDPAEDDQDSTVLSSEPMIDLSVTKRVSEAVANVGDEVTYTVTVSNVGPSDASGVEVADELPAGVRHVSHEASAGTWDPETGIWAVGELAVDDTATLTVVVEVTAAGRTTNAAQVVDAGQADVDSQPAENPLDDETPPDQDDEATAEVVGILIDLELVIAADDTVVGVGDPVTYTVTVTNEGPSNASGVPIDALLPSGVTFESSDPSVGSYDPATGIWTVGDLAVGDTITLVLVTTVARPGEITMVAQVDDADQPDVDSTPSNDDATEDDQDSVTITGELADLSLTKTVSNAAPPLGGEVTYTLTVANDGPSNATGVVIVDPLPSTLTHVAHDGPGTYDPATGRWELGDLASGASASIEITVLVHGLGTTTNVAWVAEVDQPDPDSTPSPEDPGDPTEDDTDRVELTPIPGSLKGLVWLDEDHDGTRDQGEPPIPAVTVQLLDEDGDVVSVTTTAADGTYSFTDLQPGTYTVVVDSDTLPETIAGQTYDPDDVRDGRFEVTLEAGQNVADVDFGYELETETEADPIPPAQQGALPRTGSALAGLGIVGLALLGAGVVLLGGRRRRFATSGRRS